MTQFPRRPFANVGRCYHPQPQDALWARAGAPRAMNEAPSARRRRPCESFPRVLRIECDRCGETVIHNETHMPERQRGMVLRVLLSRMRHDGCGGLAGKAELITGVEGASSRPVRRIVLVVDE